ncbi:glycosyl hydrolase family 65, N-terminal domain-containing protein [Mycena olivaceomarginata]|nr:glycosyl hydrolase family 65, N-terminal domain-containing protein [Mycena olivaceomarginata]
MLFSHFILAAALLASDVLATPETVVWFAQAGTAFTDSLMIGNGRLGASVWGGTSSDNIALNEDTLWSGGPYNPIHPGAHAALLTARAQINAQNWTDAEATINANVLGNPSSQTNFQTAGALVITTNHNTVSNYRRQLDTATGLATTSYVFGGVTYTREYLSSAPDNVIAIHINSTASNAVSFTASFSTPQTVTSSSATASTVIVTAGNTAEGVLPSAITFEKRMQVILSGGSSAAAGITGITVSNATSATILISISTSFKNYADGSSQSPSARNTAVFSKIASTAWTSLRSRHIAAYTVLFNRFSIDLGNDAALSALPTDQRVARNMATFDPGLVSLFVNLGRSLLIGSSQSKYTININIEMNYWPAEVTGLSDCVEPLARMMEDVSVTGQSTAQTLWATTNTAKSSGLPPIPADQWRATWPIDAARYGMWPTGGAWELQTLWEHFLFNPSNTTFAKRIYPLFAGSSQFFLETLVPYAGNSSWLVTNPSMSPEKEHPGNAADCSGPTLDNTASPLITTSAFAAQITATRAKLPPFLIGSGGQLQEWLIDWDSTPSAFSHISPLYAVFPGSQIDPLSNATLAKAAAQLLVFRGPGDFGWPIAWRIPVYARLMDANNALNQLKLLLGDLGVYRGLLGKNSVFQIDANLGGAGGIIEMFLQSHNGEIRLLPAVPTILPAGTIKGIRARGGYTVDLTWSNNQLASAVVTATIAGAKTMNVRLKNGPTLVALSLGQGQSRTFTSADFA